MVGICHILSNIDIVKKNITSEGIITNPRETSKIIAELAETHGVDTSYFSPFARGAQESYGRRAYIGGKQDDIAIIVAQIKFE